MEGYLIRLPSCAWNVDDDVTVATNKRNRRSRRSTRPQARLLYYVLGEGYLEGFASPDDLEPVESLQLTSFEVDVDPIYSMLMFKVTTYKKLRLGQSQSHITNDDSSEDEGDEEISESTNPMGSSLLLFAADKVLVKMWGKKLLNWNRYVFAGTENECDLAQAKTALISAFHEKNNSGMFTILCDLQDCTKPCQPKGTESPGVEQDCHSTNTLDLQKPPCPIAGAPSLVLPPPIVDKLHENPIKSEIKPLWLLLNRGSSRRIRSFPMKMSSY